MACDMEGARIFRAEGHWWMRLANGAELPMIYCPLCGDRMIDTDKED